jgi:hypothetical protein
MPIPGLPGGQISRQCLILKRATGYTGERESIMENKYFNMETTAGFTEEECDILNEWIVRQLCGSEDEQLIKHYQNRASDNADEILNDYYAK